jgi:hypothetical protein
MMAAIFALMTLALLFAWLVRARIAILCLVASLALSIGLFLFEIYSPDYGFRMPWIQVQAPVSLPVTQIES